LIALGSPLGSFTRKNGWKRHRIRSAMHINSQPPERCGFFPPRLFVVPVFDEGCLREDRCSEFQLKRPDTTVGILAPGDGFTFTTEGLISAPPGATYDTVDFAVAVLYVPVFPPIPMQTCSHFIIHKDRQGTPHWFRARNQCDRFPWFWLWLHSWFEKTPKAPTPLSG